MDYKEMNSVSCINQSDCKCSNENKECNGAVIESCTINDCNSICEQEYPYYKVPVVISEFTVQIDTESKIKLAEPAIEIKRIKKNVYLTQCRLVGETKKVFIRGFVRKNIEYSTISSSNDSAICGDIKHTTVRVPFQCLTEIKNMRDPQFHYNSPTVEVNYFDEKNMGRNMKEFDISSEEFFNEKVYCELVHANIYEADIEECEKLDCLIDEHVFQSFIEKEVIHLTIKLLQNQQIYEKKSPKCSNFYDWQEQENY